MFPYNLKAIYRYRLHTDRFLTRITEGTLTFCLLCRPSLHYVITSPLCILRRAFSEIPGTKSITIRQSEDAACWLY